MKLFACQACGNVVYFENTSCGQCGHPLAYAPEHHAIVALEPHSGGFRMLHDGTVRFLCANAEQGACNWLLPDKRGSGLCTACRHNGTIPDLSIAKQREGWLALEAAKHRLFYSLLRWCLPLRTRAEDPQHGLMFNFLADANGTRVMTGQENGIITIALSEADDIERERRRQELGEPYRTLLGHFRHETGHHFWDLLVRDGGPLAKCRDLFGDDTMDYDTALKRHYTEGPPADWQQHYVSAYAATHPWEDFAETWAHYIHIVDTLEMAANFGIRVEPAVRRSGEVLAPIPFDPYREAGFKALIDAWFPFVFAMNSVSRAMGARDLYPFVLVPPVIEKLNFIHDLVRQP